MGLHRPFRFIFIMIIFILHKRPSVSYNRHGHERIPTITTFYHFLNASPVLISFQTIYLENYSKKKKLRIINKGHFKQKLLHAYYLHHWNNIRFSCIVNRLTVYSILSINYDMKVFQEGPLVNFLIKDFNLEMRLFLRI